MVGGHSLTDDDERDLVVVVGAGRNGIPRRSRHMGAYSRTLLLTLLRLFSGFWDGPRSTVWTPSLACSYLLSGCLEGLPDSGPSQGFLV